MIDFLVLSNNLEIRIKLKNSVHCYMRHKSFGYCVETDENNLFSSVDNVRIFIVDIDGNGYMERLVQLKNKFPLATLICFTYFTSRSILLLQHHLISPFIFDKTSDYESKLFLILDEILYNSKVVNETFEFNSLHSKVIIPTNEVFYFLPLDNAVLISAKTAKNQDYTYVINSDVNNLLNQIKDKQFSFNTISTLSMKTKSCTRKSYSDEFKSKMISLYLAGASISELSKFYGPSYATISKWIKDYNYNKRIEELQQSEDRLQLINDIINK